MKNYSEVQGRDLDISVILEPIIDNGPPDVCFSINGTVIYQGSLHAQQQWKLHHDLLTPVLFEISMINKQYHPDRETALIVRELTIDGVKIIPGLEHLSCYVNEKAIPALTNYMGWNGRWRVEIDQPFYHWLHTHRGQGWLLRPIATTK